MLNDCTGTGTVTIAPDSEIRNYSFIMVNQGTEVIMIQTDAGRVITVTATKQ
jgi:hypothetical protein